MLVCTGSQWHSQEFSAANEHRFCAPMAVSSTFEARLGPFVDAECSYEVSIVFKTIYVCVGIANQLRLLAAAAEILQ